MNKCYLGDAVYVERDELGAVVLTTSNGIRDTNRIVLEPEVLQMFGRWLSGNDQPSPEYEKLAPLDPRD